MRKFTGRGPSAALLELEQADDISRPQMHAETADISDPVLEKPGYVDLNEADAEEPFLRARQRIPARRRRGTGFAARFGQKSRWIRAAVVLGATVCLVLLAGAAWETRSLLLHDAHFRLNSAQNVQVTGNRVVTQAQIQAVFDPDLGQSIASVPLAERQAQLEKIRWVRRATVMRLWPNRIRVHVFERAPIAFAREGNAVQLVDDQGVLLDLPDAAAQHYSFPILSGIASNDPLSTRAAQIELYRQLTQALDAGGGHISATLSEVDLSDPEDIRAIFTGGSRQPLVHFGASDFLPRYLAYSAHLHEWLQQYPLLRSVDMRYGRQVILDTGTAAETPSTENQVSSKLDQSQDLSSRPVRPRSGQAPRSGVERPAVSSHSKSVSRHSAKHKAAVLKRKKKKLVATRHHTTAHKPKPEHGHSVRHPIMHVVSGA